MSPPYKSNRKEDFFRLIGGNLGTRNDFLAQLTNIPHQLNGSTIIQIICEDVTRVRTRARTF